LSLNTGIPYSFHHFLSSVGEAYHAHLLQVHCKLSVSHIKEAYVTSTTRTQRFPALCLFRCAAFYTFSSWPESTAAGQKGRRSSNAHRPRKRTAISASADIRDGVGNANNGLRLTRRCTSPSGIVADRALGCVCNRPSTTVKWSGANAPSASAHSITLCQAPGKREI